jgi:tRNA(Arg) A34 adenosine deaminase TadA
MTSSHEHWIRRAIELAREARRRGDHPFGAVLVDGDQELASARNAVNTAHDVTQHAELRLVSKASRTVDTELLRRTILYTSTEPCAMCAGAIYWTGISHIVFGLSAAELERTTGGAGLHRSAGDVLGAASTLTRIDGPILEDEAREVHVGFW